MQIQIAMFLTEQTESRLRLAVQLGVDCIVAGVPPKPGPVWEFQDWLLLRKRIEDAGLRWAVCESMPIPNRVKLGLPGRDEDIAAFSASLRNMGRAGIPILCYNWMALGGWARTSMTRRVRGDALATAYNHAEMQRGPLPDGAPVGDEQLWRSLEYFLQAVTPVAEEAGVRLAMHPDDPPLSPIRGVARIMRSPDAFQQLIDLVPSPANGLTYCQGCFCEMGADLPGTIRQFARQGKLFFAHFRNLRGTAEDFHETFHDDGQADMFAAMQAYYDAGFRGPMRPDHVPTMEGDDNSRPGYSLYGRLFAIGYMRGMLEAIEKSRATH